MHFFKKWLPVFLLLPLAAAAQSLPEMKFIEGGESHYGGGYQYLVKGYHIQYLGTDKDFGSATEINIGEIPDPNNPVQSVQVDPFYMAETEVSCEQYRYFLADKFFGEEAAKDMFKRVKELESAEQIRMHWAELKKLAAAERLWPKENVWTEDFPRAHNDPLDENFVYHPAFDDYPVVGVSALQAEAYCRWLTEKLNAERREKGKEALPAFRLPTEAEWEFAARGAYEENKKSTGLYPWEGRNVFDQKGRYLANIKTGHKNYIGDNYEYTAPVKEFHVNSYGLYQMSGNVSEWTADPFQINDLDDPETQVSTRNVQISPDLRTVKGGSWADNKYAAMCGSRTGFVTDKGYSRVGFRVVRPVE